MNNLQTQHKEIQTAIKGVKFSSSASVDTRGIVRLHSEISNSNVFEKRKVNVLLRVSNAERLVYQLNTDVIPLHGTLVSVFVPGKKSSTVVNKYGNFSFEHLAMEDPNAYIKNPDVIALDKQIVDVASKIRRMKILVESQDEGQTKMHQEYETLVKKMASLKNDRMRKLHEIERIGKFSALSIEIEHNVQ